MAVILVILSDMQATLDKALTFVSNEISLGIVLRTEHWQAKRIFAWLNVIVGLVEIMRKLRFLLRCSTNILPRYDSGKKVKNHFKIYSKYSMDLLIILGIVESGLFVGIEVELG